MPQSSRQLDLLRDWEPPAATIAFPADHVRAATVAHLICRAVSTALRDADQNRTDIAKRMSDFLGETVTVNMLNAYASPAREEHPISMARFVALLHATRDRRLLELFAEPMGWAVIERKYLPMIELAAITERQRELGRHADAIRRKASQGGVL
jgi:hypothetical protein